MVEDHYRAQGCFGLSPLQLAMVMFDVILASLELFGEAVIVMSG